MAAGPPPYLRPVCVLDDATKGWRRLFDVRFSDEALHALLPSSLRVLRVQQPLPTAGERFSVTANPVDAAGLQQYLGYVKYLQKSQSTGKPRAAVIDMEGRPLSAFLLPPATSEEMAAFTAGSPVALLIEAPPAAAAPAAAAGAKRDRASVALGSAEAAQLARLPTAEAQGSAPKRQRPDCGSGLLEPLDGSYLPPPLSESAPPAPYRYVVYPDFNGELIVAPLQRRNAAAAAAGPGSASVLWQDCLEGAAPKDRGYWGRLQSTVEANDWDLVWKPTVNFYVRQAAGAPAAAAPAVGASGGDAHFDAAPTLHTLPVAGRLRSRPQLVNRMPQPRALSSKSNMFRALQAWYGALGYHASAVAVPTTFLLRPSDAAGMVAFRAHFEALARAAAAASASAGECSAAVLAGAGERVPLPHCLHNMWILKPEHLFAGRGIELASTLPEIEAFLRRVAAEGLRTEGGSSVAAGALWVVQKYVERPLMLCDARAGDRKFDVRVNVLVSDTWDVHVYADAICRTSSSRYAFAGDGEDGGAGASAGGSAAGAAPPPRHDKTAHVTNNCYQVHHPAFGAHEPGNILSLAQLQQYLDAAYGAGFVSVRRDLFPRWVELVLDVLCAARRHSVAGPPTRRRWFDMLGFDFLVDAHLRSWLLEANTNPSIDFHCAYAEGLYGRLLEGMVALAVDPHFPPTQPPPVVVVPHCRAAAAAAHVPDEAAAAAANAGGALPWAATVRPQPRPEWATAAAAPAASEGSDGCGDAGGGWQLVWSETAEAPLSIPHQAAMAPHATNAAAVHALLAAEEAAAGAGAAAVQRHRAVGDAAAYAIAAQHGLVPLLQAVTGADAPTPTPFWRPALRRFIRRRDLAWLYPLGCPPEVAAAWRAGAD